MDSKADSGFNGAESLFLAKEVSAVNQATSAHCRTVNIYFLAHSVEAPLKYSRYNLSTIG
jgi:hypothetical protein